MNLRSLRATASRNRGIVRRVNARVILAVGALAVLAYVPALRSSPGRMPADTKLYLYLDPGRLIGDARWTFDGRQFAGWVPHQVIAYLWPQGPWYWAGERFGLSDWVVHRLWIGTLLFLAGTGVLWAARRLGLGLAAAVCAALVYQLAPYVLPYISRTSAMLLPWAGLGWIVGLTIAAATRSRWRHAALAALVVVSVGAVNATAIAMVAPAPVLWLLVAARDRRITWRRAVSSAARIGGLSIAVSLWWIVMLVIQGRHGADVLAYSESLESVSFTSTSTEVWRGLGYWLTYVRDPYAATTSAGFDYMTWQRVIAAGFALLLVGVAGLVTTRWRERRFAIAVVVTGVVLAVGVHPFADPSPLMSLLRGDGTTGAALALRSSTRAVPMLMLGLALGTGALVGAASRAAAARSPRAATVTSALAIAVVAVVAVTNLPALRYRHYVDPALERDESVPDAWLEAAALLDANPTGARVLQVPGQEFGAFRWGYTVDPPLPGLTTRPLVTRELLPLGSPAAMDLLYAVDDRFQSGTVEPASLAPLSRLLGADTVWVSGDAAFDRFRTPRPEIVHRLFASGVDGFGEPTPFGAAIVNEPAIAVVDEQSISDPAIGTAVPPVELVPVEDPLGVIRAKAGSVVVVGSGDGVVDAAAAGLLDGSELLRYSASFDAAELAAAVAEADRVIVTDTNRHRAHHWRSSQDVTGYTEAPDGPVGGVIGVDVADERLPVFGPTVDVDRATVAVQVGPVTATATGYGERFAYRPEDRPVMAVDGNPATAWVVADRAPAEGQLIRLEVAEGIDQLTVRQPAGAASRRHIAQVTVTVDDRQPLEVELDERSLGADGQRIELDPTTDASVVTIRIDAVVVPDPADIGPALAAVGFAEIDAGLGPTVEVVVPPHDLDPAGADVPLTFVLTRLRTRPTDRWRSDPEPALVRQVSVGADHEMDAQITVRLDQRAGDGVLADLLGIDGPVSTQRLTGVAFAAGWAATDGDPETAWITPFGTTGEGLRVVLDAPADELTVNQPVGDFSRVTALTLTAENGEPVTVTVPPAGADGRTRIVLDDPLPAGDVAIDIAAVDARTTVDRRYAEPVTLPAAIAALSIAGVTTTIPERLDTGCRDDLLTLDDAPVPVRVQGDVASLLAGEPVAATLCAASLTLRAGTHRLTSTPGTTTGLHVDRVVLTSTSAPPRDAADSEPTVTIEDRTRTSRAVTVDECPDGCWLVLGEGFHEQWSASTPDGGLGPPQLVDGGFNGWWIEPSGGPTTVTMRWGAQGPLDIALLLSALAVLACIVLALTDGRRRPRRVARAENDADALPSFAPVGGRARLPALAAAAVTWTAGAALVVSPPWALAGLAGGALLLVLGRPRLAGYVTLAALAAIALTVYVVVGRDRPFPDAGWPVRFEYLHELGLFAAVSLAVCAFGRPPPASSGAEEEEKSS